MTTDARPTADPAPAAVVDAHAHVLLSTVESLVAGQPGLAAHRELDARRNGTESVAVSSQMVRQRLAQLTDVSRRLADMTAVGIDVQVVSPSPSHYHYWTDRSLGLTVARVANEGIAAHCATTPSRLAGLGLVPLQHPDLAVAALEHAVTQCGLLGVEISSHAPTPNGAGTIELSDERLEPFWARAAGLGAIVFLHPFGCALDERLDRWYLSNIVGQPVENAVALSHLVFSGVLDRHPDLRLLVSHGGGYLPTYLGRADHGWQVRPEAHRCAQPPSSYLRRLTFDSLVHTPNALRLLVDAVGATQVVLGSDYPFDMGVDDPLQRLAEAGLADEQQQAIRSGNAARIGLTPASGAHDDRPPDHPPAPHRPGRTRPRGSGRVLHPPVGADPGRVRHRHHVSRRRRLARAVRAAAAPGHRQADRPDRLRHG